MVNTIDLALPLLSQDDRHGSQVPACRSHRDRLGSWDDEREGCTGQLPVRTRRCQPRTAALLRSDGRRPHAVRGCWSTSARLVRRDDGVTDRSSAAHQLPRDNPRAYQVPEAGRDAHPGGRRRGVAQRGPGDALHARRPKLSRAHATGKDVDHAESVWSVVRPPPRHPLVANEEQRS